MKNILSDFPVEIRGDIASVVNNAGVLKADSCENICQKLSITIETLMIRLLPLAASYSKSPISSYKIGVVVVGEKKNSAGMANLYLGANLEYPGQALCHTVHAEQAAVSNAWLNGESSIDAIAVSASPCGFCRQFLFEVVGNKPLVVVQPNEKFDLSDLLPDAFGPLDLGCKKLMMEPASSPIHLKLLNNNELANMALQQANLSYAPYTQNFAGCALMTVSGKVFTGRYAENAAFNPGLSPYSAALSNMIMACPDFTEEIIERVVLVESETSISQKQATISQIRAYANNIELEYFPATV